MEESYCIVSDGLHKINPRVLEVLAVIGVYQDGIAKNFVKWPRSFCTHL